MTKEKVTLYYVHDPMCAWCWGYKPVWAQIEAALSERVEIVYLVGGLAPDSDIPMPEAMQQQIASYWQKIHDYLGTEFNFDFWIQNTPRRSTYPACRAVLAARKQGADKAMITAIQQAYYLQARNPSDKETLVELAEEIGLDKELFSQALSSPEVEANMQQEFQLARSIGGNSFPSLFVESAGGIVELPIDYQHAENTVSKVLSYC
ncbi:DsbA family protein [Vibrio mexicanus]|uniref:DsbA family protein n=1 Tax=Vibrio mexicanus TaxID=1004326 RepID=UPI00063C38F7|nr:DsbA family protein [Vibrio mexicanus]